MKRLIYDTVNDSIVYAGQCIPKNDSLATSLGPSLANFAGAFWGLTPYLVAAVLVALVFAGVFSALTDKAAKFIKGMVMVAGIVIGVWFLAMLIFVITGNQPDVPLCPF